MEIRRFEPKDAGAVADLIAKTLRTSNRKDYTAEYLEALIGEMTPQAILERAGWTHFYVACREEMPVGTGAIGPYWGREDESSLFTIFVLPECQGSGVGRAIMQTLERDEYFLRAKRIEIPASITAVPFYLKFGYTYKNGVTEPDGEGLLRLEKHRLGSAIF